VYRVKKDGGSYSKSCGDEAPVQRKKVMKAKVNPEEPSIKDTTAGLEDDTTADVVKPGLPYIGPISKVDAYMANGSYLETGFRINFNTYQQAFSSFFMVHNESVNVWSHCAGALCFVVFGLVIGATLIMKTFTSIPEYLAPVADKLEIQQSVEVWPIYVHLCAAVFQMGISGYFHLFCCQNKGCHDQLLKLDYAGIAIMIAGSCTGCFYYGFYCKQMFFWRCLWIGQVWVCCLFALFAVMIPTV